MIKQNMCEGLLRDKKNIAITMTLIGSLVGDVVGISVKEIAQEKTTQTNYGCPRQYINNTLFNLLLNLWQKDVFSCGMGKPRQPEICLKIAALNQEKFCPYYDNKFGCCTEWFGLKSRHFVKLILFLVVLALCAPRYLYYRRRFNDCLSSETLKPDRK